MADVRNYEDETPLSEPRGLPEDVTKSTQFDSDTIGSDGHSHSWLSSAEFSTLIDEGLLGKQFEYEYFGYLHGNGWEIKFRSDWEDGVEDYRIVFWFDN